LTQRDLTDNPTVHWYFVDVSFYTPSRFTPYTKHNTVNNDIDGQSSTDSKFV